MMSLEQVIFALWFAFCLLQVKLKFFRPHLKRVALFLLSIGMGALPHRVARLCTYLLGEPTCVEACFPEYF